VFVTEEEAKQNEIEKLHRQELQSNQLRKARRRTVDLPT
jgi:hypothetical protein